MELIFDKIKTESFGLGQGKVFENADQNGSDKDFINQQVLDAFEESFTFQSQLGSQKENFEGGGESERVLGQDPDFDSYVELLANFVEHWISVSLKDPSTRNLAKTLNCHHCFKGLVRKSLLNAGTFFQDSKVLKLL